MASGLGYLTAASLLFLYFIDIVYNAIMSILSVQMAVFMGLFMTLLRVSVCLYVSHSLYRGVDHKLEVESNFYYFVTNTFTMLAGIFALGAVVGAYGYRTYGFGTVYGVDLSDAVLYSQGGVPRPYNTFVFETNYNVSKTLGLCEESISRPFMSDTVYYYNCVSALVSNNDSRLLAWMHTMYAEASPRDINPYDAALESNVYGSLTVSLPTLYIQDTINKQCNNNKACEGLPLLIPLGIIAPSTYSMLLFGSIGNFIMSSVASLYFGRKGIIKRLQYQELRHEEYLS